MTEERQKGFFEPVVQYDPKECIMKIKLTKDQGRIGYRNEQNEFVPLADGARFVADDQLPYAYIMRNGELVFERTSEIAQFIEGETVILG